MCYNLRREVYYLSDDLCRSKVDSSLEHSLLCNQAISVFIVWVGRTII